MIFVGPFQIRKIYDSSHHNHLCRSWCNFTVLGASQQHPRKKHILTHTRFLAARTSHFYPCSQEQQDKASVRKPHAYTQVSRTCHALPCFPGPQNRFWTSACPCRELGQNILQQQYFQWALKNMEKRTTIKHHSPE